MAGELNEKCAVAAVSVDTQIWNEREQGEVNAAELVREGLFAMQHRGTEASGIASENHAGDFVAHRKDGMVKDVYRPKDIRRLAGTVAIGHNRYATSGPKCSKPQPVIDEAIGLAFAHNGNLPEVSHLELNLAKHNIRTKGLTDSELMGLAIAQNVRVGHDLGDAVQLAYPLFRGAFSSVAMRGSDEMVAFRDAKGIRPLAIGKIDGGLAVTSETCGLDMIGAEYIREVNPGEMIVISGDTFESHQIAEPSHKLDIFEIVYFASPASRLYGERVNEIRYRSGQQLAAEHPPITDDTSNILVVPVPETSTPAAEGYAESLGLQHRRAIVKNQYSGRTFIQPDQKTRQNLLRRKHNPLEETYDGKDVILIDDSIVRLNTMPLLVQRIAEHARSVTVLIASPPVRFPDFYGIDTPSQDKLAAANMTPEQMRQAIGCSYLGFLSLSRLIATTNMSRDMFSLSCFTGEYPIGIGKRKQEIYTPVSMEYID